MSEHRRAARLVVNAPCVIESIGQVPMSPHPNLAAVFRRAYVDTASVGLRFPALVRDLSTNGAFIAGPPLPLLARVALKFELRTVGTPSDPRSGVDRRSMGDRIAVDAIGWVLWQRTDDCEISSAAGPLALPKGFGVLFESIPLETRTAIAALAR